MTPAAHPRPTARPRPGRLPRRILAALPLLLALLYLSATALAATHHHAPSARDACQACNVAHGAALPPPTAPIALAPAGRTPAAVRAQHPIVIPVILRVRGPPLPVGAA
jgi:hypothetical protein